jgi:hypothetical protein
MVPSGKTSEMDGREYAIRVMNHSSHPIAIPRSPMFGWRVETLEKKVWRLKAEGGPVRRVSEKDEHIVVLGSAGNGPLTEIAPSGSADFYTSAPEAEKALRSEDRASTTFKVTLFWVAPAALAESNRDVLPCALSPEWIVTVLNLPPSR